MAYTSRKYGNNVFETAEGKFDGKNEWLRWKFLQQAEREGRIRNLRRQVEFELIPKQEHTEVRHLKTKDKIVTVFDEHPVRYMADFVYEKRRAGFNHVSLFAQTDQGDAVVKDSAVEWWTVVVEDFKGVPTDAYILKRKMMLFLKGIKIREVKKPTEEI